MLGDLRHDRYQIQEPGSRGSRVVKHVIPAGTAVVAPLSGIEHDQCPKGEIDRKPGLAVQSLLPSFTALASRSRASPISIRRARPSWGSGMISDGVVWVIGVPNPMATHHLEVLGVDVRK